MSSASLDEGIFYISEGNPADKSQNSSVALSLSLHTSSSFQSFRQCSSSRNGFTFVGGFEGKLVVACPNKALIQVYTHGKESPDQRIPIPEELTCLTSCNHPNSKKPWLLVGGSKSGKIYIWELNSGLLLQVKEVHYQAVSVLKMTSKGEFLISGSADSRVVVWKTFDLISFAEDANSLKPFATFTDHTLPVTDIVITKGLPNDIKLYSSSQDCTVRCYDIHTKSLLTTFVASDPVQSLAIDSAERTVFFGLENGHVRIVPLYVADPQTRILEKVGGNSRIITIQADPNLTSTLVHHEGASVMSLKLSIDGTSICSGDSKGRVFTTDLITRQNLKKFKELPFAISGIHCFVLSTDNNQSKSEFILPVLKRVLAGEQDLVRHELYRNSAIKKFNDNMSFDLTAFIDETKEEESVFLNLSAVESTVTSVGTTSAKEDKDKIAELEAQVQALTEGYSSLRAIHEELYSEHTKLLNAK